MSKKQTRREFLQQSSRLVAGTALAGQAATRAGAQQERPPNLLFFFPDQHRPDWIGYGPNALPISTPNLARLARTGVSFNRAVVSSPVCAPSRACLAGGREYDRCGVRKNGIPYPRDRTTYYRLLRDAGYHTMGVGKLDLAQGTRDWGSMHADAWGFSAMINNAGKAAGMGAYLSDPVGPKGPYYEYLDSLEPPRGRACAEDLARRSSNRPDGWWGAGTPSPLGNDAYCDNWIARNGLKLLREAPAERPWHLVINFVGPHPSFDITREMERTVRGPDRIIKGLPTPHHYHKGTFSAEMHVRSRQNYTAMIENIDGWLGRYIDMLEETGQLENTIIVYSSDHGEMLGDHARWGKSVPYQASLGVPLLAAGPGIRAGFESDALVTIMDLAATFLDYGGVNVPSDMDSRSLRPLLEGRTDNHRDALLSGLLTPEGDWRLVWDGRYKLVRDFGDEQYQLFDLEADPLETLNLASREAGRARRMKDWLPEGFEESA